MFYSVVRFLAGVILGVIMFPVYLGKEHVRAPGTSIVFCSHKRWWDPVFVAVGCKKHLVVMAKEEIFENKLMGFVFRKLNVYPVNRGSADIKAIKHSMSILEEGKTLLIFPEGTRNKSQEDELLEFRKGVAFLASKTGADIIPYYIRYERYKMRYIGGAGKPIKVEEVLEGVPNKQRLDVLNAHMMQAMGELKQEIYAKCK